MQTAANLTDVLLELFETELPGVRFPEVDATSLTEHRDAVVAATRVVEEAEQALAVATRVLAEHKQALALQGKRALAYVRVYAEERPALRERLDTLQSARGKSLPLSLAADEPRKRGRPRKTDDAGLQTQGAGQSDSNVPLVYGSAEYGDASAPSTVSS